LWGNKQILGKTQSPYQKWKTYEVNKINQTGTDYPRFSE